MALSRVPTKIPEQNKPVAENWCYTQTKVLKFSYEYRITDYSFCCEEMEKDLKTSTFSSGASDDIKWCFTVHPKGLDYNTRDSVYINLKLVSCSKSEVRAKFKFSILNAKQEKTSVVESRKYFKPDDSMFFELIKRDDLLTNTNVLLPEDKLTIFCEITVLDDIVNISGQSNVVQFDESECKHCEDLGNLFKEKKFTDVTLAVDGEEFQAHKAILTTRSEVFAAMFEHEMEEKKQNRITITDIDPEVLKEMLHFIYTGKAPNLTEMADELLAAADKYALKKLKMMCEKAMCVHLSVETAPKILILADRHNAHQLKAQAINFINAHAPEVMETTGWQNMGATHSRLIEEAFRVLATQHVKIA